MSRTTRRYPYGFNKGEENYEEALANHVPGVHPGRHWWNHCCDFRKLHVFHGRDGAIPLDIGSPWAKSPKCYDRWEEVWGMHRKRHAKRATGRLRRLRDKDVIAAELREEDGE